MQFRLLPPSCAVFVSKCCCKFSGIRQSACIRVRPLRERGGGMRLRAIGSCTTERPRAVPRPARGARQGRAANQGEGVRLRELYFRADGKPSHPNLPLEGGGFKAEQARPTVQP